MYRFLSCPQCKARLRVPADPSQRRFRCGACGLEISMPSDEAEVFDAIPVEETRIRAADTPTLVHPMEEQEPKPPARAGCFLHALALTPLVIAALGIPFCRFGTGWIAGILWGVFGVGLTLACVRVVRRTRWPWVARLLMALGLTGAGQVILVGALAVSFWLWLHRIDPSDWQDFAPPGGRFHISVPGKPVQNTTAMQGMPPGFQTYQLELHRQDVVLGISFGDVPLEEWAGTSLQVRFNNSLDGMKANLPGSEVVSQKHIALDGNPGREFHLEIPGRAVIVARVYFVRNRLYVLLIAGSRIKPDSEEVTKFLDSFQPDPLDDKQFPPLRPDQQPPDIEDEDIIPGRTILSRKEHTVEQIAVARDGGTLAAAYEDGAIDLWDLTTKQKRAELKVAQKGHQPFVSWVHLDLSPDGKALVVGTLHGELKLFDTATQNETATLARAAESQPVDRVAFSPGGRYLASAHRDLQRGQTEVRVWDVPARKLVRMIRGWKGQVTALTFAPDGRSLIAGGEDGSIRWHDPLTGAEVKRYQLKKNNPLGSLNVTALAFTADGAALASSHFDHTTRLWDVRTGQDRVVHQLPAAVVALDITANGRFLATGTFNNQLLVSEAATGKKRWEQPGVALNQTAPARGLAFTPDGKQLVLARQKRVELWDLARMIQATPDELAEPKERPAVVEPEPSPGEPPPRIEAHTTKDPNTPHGVFALDLSADGKTLITVGRDRNLRFWDMATGVKRGEAIVGPDLVSLAVSPDGKTAAVAVPSTVTLYDTKSGERVDTLTPDAAEIAGAMMDLQVREIVIRQNKGKLPAPPPGTIKVGALAFAPDGQTLAVAYAEHRSGVVELWDVAARKVGRRFVTQGGGGRLAFAPDGKTLATGRDNDAVVRLYDVATGKEYARLQGLEWGVGAMVYSGDGRYLAAISTGAAVVLLWDAKTGQEVHRFKDHKQRLWSLALSRDGKTLATGDMEGTVLVYDTASGKHIGTFADVAASLVFSRDGRTLIAGGGDGWVESWSIANLPRPKPPEAPVAQNKPPPRPLAFGKDLQAVGKVEPFLAIAVDPRAGRALFLCRDRFLRVYSYPEFKPEKAYWLGATAYRATLDRQRGMLYAAVCEVQALKMERDGRVSGPADIYVYDVKKILAGEDLSDHVLRPTAMVPVKSELTHLQATADYRWIYYLEAGDWKGKRLGRIDAVTRKADRTTTVSDATGAFGLGRDGKTLYLGRTRRDAKAAPQQLPGEIQVFDPATMAMRGSIDVPSKPKEIAVEDELLFFGGEGPLGVVDLRPAKPAVVAHWQGPWFGGRYHVGIAPRRVYIAANSVPATIRAFDFPDNAPIPKDRPLELDSVSDDGDGRLLGELTSTPDGKYLLCRTGEILRLALPGLNRPLPPHQQDEKPPVDPKGLPWHERPILTSPRRGFVQAVAIAPDDTMLALGDGRGGVFVYERASGKLLGTAPSDSSIAYLTFAPKGKKLISTTLDRGGQIRVTGKGTSIGGTYAFFRDVAGHGLDSVAFTANARELAGAGGAQGKDVVFWNAETGRVVKTVRGFPDPLTAVALSVDGKRVAAGSTVGPVRQANLANPRETRTMTGQTAEVRCVAYAPDGKTLASGGVDTTARLWDTDTGKEVRKLRGHTNVVLCLTFSPDGKMLVTGGADGTVRVWDVATGNERGVIPPRRPGAMVYALAFAPDGHTLAAACGEEVRQWEIGTD